MRDLTCGAELEGEDLRCWRREGTCDGRHFAVRPSKDPETTTRPDVVRWTDED